MLEKDQKKHSLHSYDSIIRYAEFLGFGEIHTKIIPELQFHAIIAIHSTARGPALGGCRLIHYPHADEGVKDALRLAQMMTLKASITNLPQGGGKAVIIKPPSIPNREAFFEAFGEFVNQQNGRYITAVDCGTDSADMDVVARRTSYLTCTTFGGYAGDPAPYTALGVRRGIDAAVQFKLNKNNLKDIHVAIQGAGHVGYCLTKELIHAGARVSITDINKENLQRVSKEFPVTVIDDPDKIYDVACDVFAPCALGGILNLKTIAQLKVSIVAGSANNQLDHHHHGLALHERGILYAPDFVINSGGLIHVSVIYNHGDQKKANEQIYNLYDTTMAIFERSKRENRPTSEIAEIIAYENLQQPRGK